MRPAGIGPASEVPQTPIRSIELRAQKFACRGILTCCAQFRYSDMNNVSPITAL